MKTLGSILLLSLLAGAIGQDIEDAIGQDIEDAIGQEVDQNAAAAPSNQVSGAAAPSNQVSCNCQCSNITFLDKYGRTNGNCRSVDITGALWCYVNPRYSQCSDLRKSSRINQLFSYQACATPKLNSPQCYFAAPVAAPAYQS